MTDATGKGIGVPMARHGLSVDSDRLVRDEVRHCVRPVSSQRSGGAGGRSREADDARVDDRPILVREESPDPRTLDDAEPRGVTSEPN